MNRHHTNHALRFLPIFLLVCAAGVVPCSVAAQEKHPFGLDDYSALRRARALAVSPDGKLILYNVSFDGDKGPIKNEWRLIDMSGENSRKLELPESFHPSGFTKDGQSLFGTYEVDKKGQLGIVPLGGGNPTQIIALPNGIHGTWISPDGDKFAFTADPSPVDPLAEVRHVVENDVTSVYVATVNGSQGAWWCPDLKDVSELAGRPTVRSLPWLPNIKKSAITTCIFGLGLLFSRCSQSRGDSELCCRPRLGEWRKRFGFRQHHNGCPDSRSSLDRFRFRWHAAGSGSPSRRKYHGRCWRSSR